MTDFLLAIADDTQLHLRILRTFQTMHSLLVGTDAANEDRIVDLDNLITSQHASALSRAVANDILHTDGILADDELDADAEERAAQVIVGYLTLTSRDIHGVRIELCKDLRHGFLHQVIDIHSVYILIVNDVQQVVQLISAGIDDIQPVTGKMIGIKRPHENTSYHADGHPDRGKPT